MLFVHLSFGHFQSMYICYFNSIVLTIFHVKVYTDLSFICTLYFKSMSPQSSTPSMLWQWPYIQPQILGHEYILRDINILMALMSG